MSDCKWCGISLDWRVENGKPVPYEVNGKVHYCPKRPNSNGAAAPAQQAKAPVNSTGGIPVQKVGKTVLVIDEFQIEAFRVLPEKTGGYKLQMEIKVLKSHEVSQ